MLNNNAARKVYSRPGDNHGQVTHTRRPSEMNILVLLHQTEPFIRGSDAPAGTARIEVNLSDLTEPQHAALAAVLLDGHDATRIGLRADTGQIAAELSTRKGRKAHHAQHCWKTGPLRVISPTLDGLRGGLDRLLLEQRDRYQRFCRFRDEFLAEAKAVIDSRGVSEEVTFFFIRRDGQVVHQGCRNMPPVEHIEVPVTLNVNLVPEILLRQASLLPDELGSPLLKLQKRLQKEADAEANHFISKAKAQLEAMEALVAFAPTNQIRIIAQEEDKNCEILVVLPKGETVRHRHDDRRTLLGLALCVEMEEGEREKEGCCEKNVLLVIRQVFSWMFAQEPSAEHPVTIQTRIVPNTMNKRYEVTMPIPEGTTHIRLNDTCVYRIDLHQRLPVKVAQARSAY